MFLYLFVPDEQKREIHFHKEHKSNEEKETSEENKENNAASMLSEPLFIWINFCDDRFCILLKIFNK